MRIRPLLRGLVSFVPGAEKILQHRRVGGTTSASYCYGVWLKHMTLLGEAGICEVPRSVAELGPGESLGVGLAAILSGAESYCALDVAAYSNTARNLAVFDELLDLFRARAPRPSRGWPDYDAHLGEDLFPHHILTNDVLAASISQARVDAVRKSIVELGSGAGANSGDGRIRYMTPWADPGVIRRETVDLILSHSVLEHVADLETTYQACWEWLKPTGVMSHQIDLSCHGLWPSWNGHRSCPEGTWRIIAGKRTFLLNREPCSAHIEMLKRHRFELIQEMHTLRDDGIGRERLAKRWRTLSDHDLQCAGIFIQARRL